MPAGGSTFPTSQDVFPANHPYRELVDPITNIENYLLTSPIQIEGASHLLSGAAAPVLTGVTGDFYFRTGATGATASRIYVCTGGTAWTGIA